MKETTKRILSLVLAFVMVLGLLPGLSVNVSAAGDTHYLMFATDRHANTSVIGNIINNMESTIGENTLEYLGLGGDMVGSGNTHPDYDSSEVLTEVTNATSSLNADNVDIVAGIHDMNVNDDAGIVLPYQDGGAQIYEGDDYYIYGVEEYCISDDSDEQNWVDQADAFEAWANSAEVDPSKAIIVVSHYPLHAKRDDNDGAMYWHWALNAVATGNAYGSDTTVERDIVFFHGHNHTVDSNEYVYNVGDTMEIQNGSKTESAAIYYTYATAGYLNQNKKATLVTITDDQIVLTKYGTSGAGTAMAAVERVVTETAPVETTVPEDTTPVLDGLRVCYSRETLVGEELALTVYAVYTDGTEVEVEDYTVEGYDPTVIGAQAVFVTYENQTYAFNVVSTEEVTVVADGMGSVTVTDVTEELTEALADILAEGFVAYDIVPNDYNVENNVAVVSMPAPEGANAVFFWNEETEALEPVADFVIEGGKAVFTTNHFSTYVVGAPAVNGGQVTVPGNSVTTTEEKTVYVLTDTIAAGDEVLIVSANSSSGYILGGDTGADNTVTIMTGNLTVDGNATSYTYVENYGSGLVWTVGNGYTFTSGSYKLGMKAESGWFGSTSYSLTTSASDSSASYNWTYNNYTLRDNTNNRYAYYRRYYNDNYSSWTQSEDSQNVYLYKKVTATETTTTGTQTATYGINITVDGTAASTMEAKNVVNGDTLKLGTAFTSTVDGQLPSGGSYAWETTTSNGVASVDENGLVTFTGKAGTEVVKVSYTWTVDGVSYTIYNTLTITATAMGYTFEVTASADTIKVGASAELTVTAKNTEGSAVTAENIVWTSSNSAVATVENGVVTGLTVGETVITAQWTDPAGVVHEEEVTVYVVDAVYTMDITYGGNVVTGTTIAQKGVTAATTLQLGTKVYADGVEVSVPANATIQWNIPEEYHTIATVDHDTGLVTFKGVDGAFYVMATLTVNGKDYTVGVNISASTTSYSTPNDGPADFPEYPNEGAIRFDKTGTAVGNFSETGIAQVELSMTGVPYTTGSEVDVVLMLDMTGSMDDVSSSTSKPTGYVRIDATIAASKAFISTIVTNEDGSYNGNRVGVYVFNKNGAATLYDFGTVDSDTELEAIYADLETIKDDHFASGGTPYDDGLAKCQEVLAAAKTDGIGNNRQQFTIFMTDGVPTSYAYVNGTSYGTHSSASAVAGMLTSASDYAIRDTDYKYEYYSTEMKKDRVTVYAVGVGLENENNAWSGSATQCLNLASALLNDISGPAGETTQPDGVGSSAHSKQDKYFFSVEDATAGADMTKVFSDIAVSILQAATDITVEDQITDEYTMIFDIPEGTKDITGVTKDFYIEFGKYALDENHERTTFTSVTKLYLENTNGVLSAKDSTDPVFEQKTIGDKGTLYYWSTNADDGDTGVSVTVDETTYYFVSYGLEEAGYNMTSGAYARGTVDSTTNMSTDLVIATPYFVYNADTRMLYWTVDKLDTYEYALRYFLYLNNSATEVATSKETDPGPYPTNDHAYITYTNFNGNDCRQVFPIPQLTWNGAQVSYVFYLVNAAGQPINKSGQVVDFANATFITDVYTEAVVWNKAGETSTGTGELSANWLADDLLPDEYEIYDKQAHYALNVYENADGSTIKNQFTISGGTAGEISTSLNTRLDLETTASTVSISTTKVYNTKAGEKISAYGTYTSADSNMTGFDFANTTVAFAVVWQPRLVPDVVVVDYGLDVLINVVQNDILQNKVTGIGTGTDAYGTTAMNTGVVTESKLGTAALTIDGNAISLENETSIRFHQGDMEFSEAVEFYYETPVEFWEGSDPTKGYMYSSVTVIPATTIYYEDEFVDLSIWDMNDVELNEEWAVVGTTVNDTQDQDRPGDSKISDAIDADNIYGYDSAYTDCAMYSMGSARVVTVDDTRYAEAQFTFYGTGFDIISLTSNTSGTISVDVYGADDFAANEYGAAVVKSGVVDTYYGYTQDEDGNWIVDTDVEGKLYQIPVMKISDLEYGKYTVIITTAYYSKFDHQNHGSLDFYLDAVRIYDPTGNADSSINDYYVEDHEGWPVYQELRNNVIESADDAGQIAGAVYIDGAADNVYAVADYNAYGPNNELYLAPGQMIAFSMNLDTLTKLDKLHIAMKSANGGTVSCQIFDAASIQDQGDVEALKAQTIATATDLYYDISDLKDDTIVIYNSSTNGAILSITNLKATFTEDPGDVTINFSVIEEDALTALLTALNTAETEGEETTDPTDPSEPSEGTEDEDTGSGSSSTIGQIIDWLRKLLGWG